MDAFETTVPRLRVDSIAPATDLALRSIPTWKQRRVRIVLPATPMVRGRMNYPQRLWRFLRLLMRSSSRG
jgi:hypothetical protein